MILFTFSENVFFKDVTLSEFFTLKLSTQRQIQTVTNTYKMKKPYV